ncbi:MAG: class I adenylate-forming enzyme family protein [Verrucomicrobiota bacterium]
MSQPSILINRWEAVISERADQPAIFEGESDRVWTFNEIEKRSLHWKKSLSGEKIDRHAVVLDMPNGLDWVAALLMLLREDSVVVPVDTGITNEQRIEIGEMVGARGRLSLDGWQKGVTKPRQWDSELCLLKVTSGSSGSRQAIPFTGNELCADADNIQTTMAFGPNDRNYALLPFGHSYALGNLIVPLLTNGVPLVLGSSAFPRAIAEEVRRHQATVFPGVPAIFEGLANTDDVRLDSLRLAITAAAPLKPELAKRFLARFGQPLHNFYGASECGGIAYDRTGDCGFDSHAIGTPLKNVELDTDGDGLLNVRSAAVSSFGRKKDALGNASIWLNDRVHLGPNSEVSLLGRADRVVKCMGKRIDLEAIESVASKIPYVRSAATIYLEDSDRLAIVYSGSANSKTVLESIQSHFPEYRARFRVKRVDTLPQTERGKIDQAKLRRMFSMSPSA